MTNNPNTSKPIGNPAIKEILEKNIEADKLNKELGPSTYTESHKRYYERYKALIMARSRKYRTEYKKQWYKKNRARILRELAEKRANKQLELPFDQP